MQSGTTITKATAASLRERTDRREEERADRRAGTGSEVPSLPRTMPEIQLQYWTTSGRSTPSLSSSALTACRRRRVPEVQPSRVAGQDLAGEEHEHAQEHNVRSDNPIRFKTY